MKIVFLSDELFIKPFATYKLKLNWFNETIYLSLNQNFKYEFKVN
jgi:hypothetical protein